MIADPLLAAAARQPDRTALVAGVQRISYRSLARSALALATRLRAIEIRPGDRVALLASKSLAAVVAIHGVRLAGAVLVPLSRRSPPAELERLGRRVQPALVLFDGDTGDLAAALDSVAPVADLSGLTTAVGFTRSAAGATAVDHEAPGAIVFTSGTTGEPRSAVLRHRNLLASATSWNAFLRPARTDVWLATLPLGHVAGLGIILRATLEGLPVVVHERFDPEAVLRDLGDAGVSHVSLVPTQLHRILEAAGGSTIHAPALRAVLLGGAPIPPQLVREAMARGLPVVPTYGLTEAASGVTALAPEEAAGHPDRVGRALPGIGVETVRDDGSRAAPGEVGEIVVGGPTVFAGYEGDPEATARALRDGRLHTGDLGSFDEEGRLVVVERRLDRIISGGENVSPTEVEVVLTAHPDVAEAVVVGHPDPEWGTVPVAAVTLRPGSLLADLAPEAVEAALRGFARQHLAGFKVPKRIVRLDAIPKTPSGKVPRRLVGAKIEALLGERGASAPVEVEPARPAELARSAEPARPVAHLVEVGRPDGAVIAVQRRGVGPPLLLLHATLSTAADYEPLAERLADRFTVLAVDRRSAGASREPLPRPASLRRQPADAGVGSGSNQPAIPEAIDVSVHVADLVAVLDELVPDATTSAGDRRRALVVGHSFGGVVGLELAARHPELVAGVWAFEPPYVPLAPPAARRALAALPGHLAAVAARDGVAAAGPAFLAAVAGLEPTRLSQEALRRARAEARSALADATLRGLDPRRLRRIVAPVTVALGGRSLPLYRSIAEGLAAGVPELRLETLPELDHAGPLRAADRVAEAIHRWAGQLAGAADSDGGAASGAGA